MLLGIKNILLKSLTKVCDVAKEMTEIAKDDPRKLIHSFKFGFALTLVSLFFYMKPLYENFGVTTMWAVVTVVVVFEFSVGATIGKGINRAAATLLAGALGLGAHHLARITGKTCEPILLELFVFLFAVACTFVRFYPKIKARYDYGMMMCILTFSLVTLSDLQTDEMMKLFRDRLSTVTIGALISVIVSIFVFPVWAGEDLHKLVARNLKKLGDFLEGLTDECFKLSAEEGFENKRVSHTISLNSVLADSEGNEKILANFAKWEPGHGRFMYRHPWKQYLKIGNLTRRCAGGIDALSKYLDSKTQAPKEIQSMIQESFSTISSECGKALKEQSWAIETMTRPSCPNPHVQNLKTVSKDLESLLKSSFFDKQSDNNLLLVMQVSTVASLLIDTVASVENIQEAVNELSSLANFKCKKTDTLHAHHIVEIPGDVNVKGDRSSDKDDMGILNV